MKVFKLSLFILALNSQVLAAGGDSVGNGGDGISQVFEDARLKAVKLLERLDPCSTPVETKREVKEWLLAHRLEIIEDVKNSQHIWKLTDAKQTCAWTKSERNNDILFSTKSCREKIYDIETAAALLIHESVHHLGVESDAFAKDVGSAVRHSETRHTCQYDPFQPESCKFDRAPIAVPPNLKPDSTHVVVPYASLDIGEWRLFSRSRVCKDSGRCAGWTYNDENKRTFYDDSDKSYTLATSGRVLFNIEAPYNDIYLKTLGDRTCQLTSKVSFCHFGMGPGEANDLYEKVGSEKQKLSFVSVFTGNCLRQYAKLLFRKPGSNAWLESEHVVFFPD